MRGSYSYRRCWIFFRLYALPFSAFFVAGFRVPQSLRCWEWLSFCFRLDCFSSGINFCFISKHLRYDYTIFSKYLELWLSCMAATAANIALRTLCRTGIFHVSGRSFENCFQLKWPAIRARYFLLGFFRHRSADIVVAFTFNATQIIIRQMNHPFLNNYPKLFLGPI